MKYIIDNDEYYVKVIKKNIKKAYIRVTEDLVISITINKLATKKKIMNLLDSNDKYIKNMLDQQKKQIENIKMNKIFNQEFDIIIVDNFEEIDITNRKIYIKSLDNIDKLYRLLANDIFNERLTALYASFEENIPYPKLKIRTMKTRWGVCNKKDKAITLNLNLIRYEIEKIDYVIIHELCHFVHFDHSPKFWELVAKYIPNYKKIRREMRE